MLSGGAAARCTTCAVAQRVIAPVTGLAACWPGAPDPILIDAAGQTAVEREPIPRLGGTCDLVVDSRRVLVSQSCLGRRGRRRCGRQRYTVRFTGRVDDGRLTAEGTLDNVNATTLDGCTNDGHPTSCPFYEAGPGSLAIALAGTYDPTSGRGNGSFTVAVARPTSGTWSVG
jgi:hypothetical protein